MGKLVRLLLWGALASLGAACTLFIERVHVERVGDAEAFTEQEQQRARAIVLEICRAARFSESTTASSSGNPYLTFVSLDGKGSEQDTVAVAGQISRTRREIIVTVGDDARAEPLPTTQKLVTDLRAALEHSFPESRVTVTRDDALRLFGP